MHDVCSLSVPQLTPCFDLSNIVTTLWKYQLRGRLPNPCVVSGTWILWPPTRSQSRSHRGSIWWRILPPSTSFSGQLAGTESLVGWYNDPPATAVQRKLMTSKFQGNACDFRSMSQHLWLEAGAPFLRTGFLFLAWHKINWNISVLKHTHTQIASFLISLWVMSPDSEILLLGL